MAQPTQDPNVVPDTICPIRSGVDTLPTPDPFNPTSVRIQIIPKHAPCMKNCTLFDSAKSQCMIRTTMESLANLSKLGGLIGGP